MTLACVRPGETGDPEATVPPQDSAFGPWLTCAAGIAFLCMPYRTLSELPEAVRGHLPRHAQEIYRSAYNNAWDEYGDPKKRRSGSREATAHRVAWAAVKELYEKCADGKWRRRA